MDFFRDFEAFENQKKKEKYEVEFLNGFKAVSILHVSVGIDELNDAII